MIGVSVEFIAIHSERHDENLLILGHQKKSKHQKHLLGAVVHIDFSHFKQRRCFGDLNAVPRKDLFVADNANDFFKKVIYLIRSRKKKYNYW